MAILVTGAGGQLGRALAARLPDARLVTSADLDITDRAALDAFDWTGITALVNAAAWTAVDKAEDAGSTLAAWDVNAAGVANLAWHARRLGIPLVHVSTDYVFGGGEGFLPAGHPIDPQGVYGITKAAGELAARLSPTYYVVRTSWVFGDGPNFVRTMLRLGAERDELTVVDDQYGRPTYTVDLAAALIALLESEAPSGTYHATGAGDVVSWADFAAAILAGTSCKVRPISSAEYAQGKVIAPRPANSALDLSALEAVGITMRDWREALAEYLETQR
ncbi:dTDP-4-dehydrorhamnose reductase [Kribbella flavida DSM 17836]|uniref:dTDP-4-dehydrorhamnose reductase n=1 Tax=Kribbella flavida (strain DSM 17836 / JCM 10339 / NBRC 14399) TaxID=479435 RepID=D2PVZ8_KRIFD|nr:dTDP-4-dehydrorhamnose reductase [Kribbella flavida]ADB29655.1 dTDP-4-dehydrorhamnose reductase [Kribbella flavida DSM 17836]